MRNYTEEEKALIEKKAHYETLKAKLLKEYKSYAPELHGADNLFDEEFYQNKREKLAVQIKRLGEKLREIEQLG